MEIFYVYSIDCNDGYSHVVSAHKNEGIAKSKVEHLTKDEEERERIYNAWIRSDHDDDDEGPEMPLGYVYQYKSIKLEE